MNIYDVHIHAENTVPNPEELLKRFDKAGIYGGCIFSNWPKEANETLGTSFNERLEEVLAWTTGHEDRLFPVLWIHPYEEDILNKITLAVNRGICAFKIICTNFYIYEEQCLEVLRKIASLNKPVFFHSGILWDSQVSSNYNRPLNWEALLRIEGLRFSMGHCSWPWIDECVALYGKFLNALTTGKAAEMFFDITPGTPPIYRKELLTKLYTIGYDVGDNILFGTDASAHTYSVDWVSKWLKTDGSILDTLGVSRENREKLYYHNLLRFLGKNQTTVTHASPVPDNANTWLPYNKEVSAAIEQWYLRLHFPSEYNREFYKALAEIPISDAISAETLDLDEPDGRRALLSSLYICETLKPLYEKRGIPLSVLEDTAQDLVRWTITWSALKRELFLGELPWLKYHLSGKLFQLGRLQFAMGYAHHAIPAQHVEKGDPVIEIHIPQCGPLSDEDCEASITRAKEFFAAYFPEFEYKCFTCHSWLLDSTLKQFLKPDSNIIKFQDRFTFVMEDTTDAILRYVFQWDTTRATLDRFACTSGLAVSVREYVRSGGEFHETLGFFPRD